MRLTRIILVTSLVLAAGSSAHATGAYVCRFGPYAPPPAPYLRCEIDATSDDQSKPCNFKSPNGMTVQCLAAARSTSDMLICVAGLRPATDAALHAVASVVDGYGKLPEGDFNALAFTTGDDKGGVLNLSFPEAPGGTSFFVFCAKKKQPA